MRAVDIGVCEPTPGEDVLAGEMRGLDALGVSGKVCLSMLSSVVGVVAMESSAISVTVML